MSRFRALLLGVAEYDDPGIRDLPFVGEDLTNVATALEARGYEVEMPVGGGRLGRTRIMTEVSNFLVRARSSDTLLIYLSGHGAHADQEDYLLPSDADQSWPKLSDVSVPLSAWGQSIENSQARAILFTVDACREGFREDVKSVVARTAWAHDKVVSASRRNVAWMFPCAPGEVARFASPVGGSDESSRPFSLFSRAVEQSVTDSSAPLTLAEFQAKVAARMTALATEFGMPHQQIRVAGEADHGFVVLPQRPGVAGGDSEGWETAAAGHSAWRQVDGRPGDNRLRDAVIAFVRRLAEMRREAARRLTLDPWQEPGFALRMTDRMEFLLGSLLGELRLSPAEAALLVVMPFAYDVHWARLSSQASAVNPADLRMQPEPSAERAEFEKYLQGYPRLLRRAASVSTAGDQASMQIGWWLLHRWIVRQQSAFNASAVGDLLAEAAETGAFAEVFTPARMSELIRVLRADVGFIARTDRPHGLSATETIRAGLIDEQMLRERMVGYLLMIAHRLAIEITALPDVVADHICVADPVDPIGLRAAVEGAKWEPRGSGRVLRAACPHPAIEVALREHVAALDGLLADLRKRNDADLAILADLPGRTDADKVRAAESDGTASYISASVRFHLDETRVQELLMGRQLYGQSDLAIREIYQNALDACRYRKARTEYLQRSGRNVEDWEGRIRFEQGFDEDGRPYIDCQDNGIGMGLRELRDVFAQAGTRFAELPEFLEEQAAWETLDPPVKLYPNSRFGIGVLSYFMLADEITVETCRLGQDGVPGRRLKVSIAGPGTLFRIIDVGPGSEAGTTVRLHLRPNSDEDAASCVDTLRNVLWISEFFVEASDGIDRAIWRPGELKDRFYSRTARFPVRDRPVWWCDGGGAVLVDGLEIDYDCFGFIVNLTGENSPQLSVDRNEILDTAHNRRILTKVLSDAVFPFASADGPFLTFDWLCEFTDKQPAVADLIFELVCGQGSRELEINGHGIDITRLGFFAPDRDLVPESDLYLRPDYSWRGQQRRIDRHGVEPLTDRLMAWRLAAISDATNSTQTVSCDNRDSAAVIKARPSDWVILHADPRRAGTGGYGTFLGLADDQPVPVRHLVAAAERVDRPIGQVADRLAELGWDVPRALHEVGPTEPWDLMVLHRTLAAHGASFLDDRWWLDETEPVPIGHVVGAAAQIGRPVDQVAQRLLQLRFQVSAELLGVKDVEPADRIIVSRDLDGQGPWLSQWDSKGSPRPVPRAHVVAAAAQVQRPVGQVAGRLAALGFQVAPGLFDAGPIDAADQRLISESLDGMPPMLAGLIPVPPGHLLAAAHKFGQSLREIADTLAGLGFQVPSATLKDDSLDLRILSWELDGLAPWLNTDSLIPTSHVIAAAELVQKPIDQVARQLADQGLHVHHNLLSVHSAERADRIIISREQTGEGPWLRQWDEDDQPILVPVGHIAAAAEKNALPIGRVARRLSALGFHVSSELLDIGDAEAADRTIASRDLTGVEPWLTENLVPLGHILTAANRLNEPAKKIANRLTKLGFDIPPLPSQVTSNDYGSISWELRPLDQSRARELRYKDRGWWLHHDTPVPMWHVVAGAAKARITIEQQIERLSSFGFQTTAFPDTCELFGFC